MGLERAAGECVHKGTGTLGGKKDRRSEVDSAVLPLRLDWCPRSSGRPTVEYALVRGQKSGSPLSRHTSVHDLKHRVSGLYPVVRDKGSDRLMNV